MRRDEPTSGRTPSRRQASEVDAGGTHRGAGRTRSSRGGVGEGSRADRRADAASARPGPPLAGDRLPGRPGASAGPEDDAHEVAGVQDRGAGVDARRRKQLRDIGDGRRRTGNWFCLSHRRISSADNAHYVNQSPDRRCRTPPPADRSLLGVSTDRSRQRLPAPHGPRAEPPLRPPAEPPYRPGQNRHFAPRRTATLPRAEPPYCAEGVSARGGGGDPVRFVRRAHGRRSDDLVSSHFNV